MKKALLLVDIQKDYFENGRMTLHNTKAAAENAKLLLDQFRKENDLVVFIKHVSKSADAPFFIKGTDGCDISDIVKPEEKEAVVVKEAPSSFYKTGLNQLLQHNDIDHLVVCGMMSHMCIDTTVRAAYDYGYKVTLIEDACTTTDLKFEGEVLPAETVHKVMMASLQGTFAKIIKTEEYLSTNC